MKKGEHLLTTLTSYFDGERYMNTGGADKFFIPTSVENVGDGVLRVLNNNTKSARNTPFDGEIEARFLRPLIKDYTKRDKRVQIRGYDSHCLVVEGTPSSKLKKYIRWGEEQGFHRTSVTRLRNPWYKPTVQMLSGAKVLMPRSFNDRFIVHYNPSEFLSLRFYRLHPKWQEHLQLVAFLNSTLVMFFVETLGNKNLGQGVLDFFMADFLAMRIPVVLAESLSDAFTSLGDRAVQSVWDEMEMSDRHALDDIVFEALDLTQGERDAVYEAVIDLVETRLKKASSLNQREVQA